MHVKTLDEESIPSNTAPQKEKKKKMSEPAKTPSAGDKFTGTYELPTDLVIIGLDVDAPDEEAPPLLHRVHQPERLRDIQRDGVNDLVATILASGGKVLEPVEYVTAKIGDETRKVIATGRRRTLAARYINENLEAINKRREEEELPLIEGPVLVKATKRDAADPNLWLSIRSENAGRMAESPLSVAADVALMLEGDPNLGVAPMTYDQIGALYGRNHQFARAMAKLDKASDNVKKALRKGKLSQTAAQEIATIKGHEAQDARLEIVLAEGGTAAAAKAVTRKDRPEKDLKEVKPPKNVKAVREAVRGLEELLSETDKRSKEYAGLVAAHSTLSWVLSEDESTEYGEAAASLWLAVDKARSRGEYLIQQDRESAQATEQAEKEARAAARAAEREAARAAKEAERAAKAAEAPADAPKKRGRPPKVQHLLVTEPAQA